MKFDLKVTGIGAFKKGLRQVANVLDGPDLVSRVEQWLNDAIADIRTGKYFIAPRGTLETGIKAVVQGKNIFGVWSGPGAVYGPILERKRTRPFTIKPLRRNLVRAGAPRAGLPIKALEIQIPGQPAFYRRKIIIQPTQMVRPHWKPALEKTWPWFVIGVRDAITRAKKS